MPSDEGGGNLHGSVVNWFAFGVVVSNRVAQDEMMTGDLSGANDKYLSKSNCSGARPGKGVQDISLFAKE
jgi:hypothetical protein